MSAGGPGAGVADLVRSPVPPVERLGEVLDLLDELSGLSRALEGVGRQLETASGLRGGELQTLVAVSEGATHARAVARGTGQADRAGAVTVEALVRRGLLRRERHPGSPEHDGTAALVRLTEAGRGVLAQVQGLQIRALAAVVHQLGDTEAESLRGTVRALDAVLTGSSSGALRAPAEPSARSLGG